MGCGRNDKRHALEHYRSRHKSSGERQSSHCVFLEANTYQCWCYECDDLICPPLFGALESYNSNRDDAVTISSSTSSMSKRRGLRASSLLQLPLGVVGLYNLGNSCYMNAAIQALLNCPSIMGYFRDCAAFVYRDPTAGNSMVLGSTHQPTHPHQQNQQNNVAHNRRVSMGFQKLVEAMYMSNSVALSPSRLVREVKLINPVFHGYTQQDTMDFVRCIFERIHEETGYTPSRSKYTMADDEQYNTESVQGGQEKCIDLQTLGSPLQKRRSERLAKSNTPVRRGSITSIKSLQVPAFRSIISDTFGGVLRSEIHCLECNNVSVKDDLFYDVSVQITATCEGQKISKSSSLIGNFFTSIGESIGINGKPVKLESCLSAFCAPETLEGKDRYRCEKCNRLVRSKKALRFKKLPQILVLQMKRFRHDSYFSSKIGTHVSFPIDNLDLMPYLHETTMTENGRSETRYYLSAIINHRGTFGGGHYVAYCKNHSTGQWFEFNDSNVNIVTEEEVSKVQAYVLFYSMVEWNARGERETWLSSIPIISFANGHKDRVSADNKAFSSMGNEKGVFVSQQWLNRWRSMCEPGPIDSSELFCPHKAILPDKNVDTTDLVQFIPNKTYEYLSQRHGEIPGFACFRKDEACRQCIKEEKELDERRLKEEQDIQSLDTSTIKTGEYWYLICSEWLLMWGKFKSGIGPLPGPVCNEHLIVEKDPRPGLVRGTHYRGINKRVWDYFVRAYGGGPAIIRKTINIYGAPVLLSEQERSRGPESGFEEDAYVDVIGH